MPIRKIAIAGRDKVLRQKAREIAPEEFGTDWIKSLAADMAETMVQSDGVGIAAPQVGESVRLFLVETPDGPAALANPSVRPLSEARADDYEGCLSCPGETVMVSRCRRVSVTAKSLQGEDVSFEAKEYMARIIQHENDHLDGVLIIDKK